MSAGKYIAAGDKLTDRKTYSDHCVSHFCVVLKVGSGKALILDIYFSWTTDCHWLSD